MPLRANGHTFPKIHYTQSIQAYSGDALVPEIVPLSFLETGGR